MRINHLFLSLLTLLPLQAFAADPGQPNPLITLAMFGGLFVFMYFLIIRPQRKRQKEHTQLAESLSKGDEIVLNSGLLGKINKIEGAYLVIQVNDNVEMKYQKVAVHAVLPKGTIKSI